MKRTLAALAMILLTMAAYAQPRTVCTDTGLCFDVPKGFELRLVPKHAPDYLVGEKRFRTIKPSPQKGDDEPAESVKCTPAGELSLGAPPC